MTRDRRGFTLIEFLVAGGVLAFIMLALGSLFLGGMRAMQHGTAAGYVQRQGTLLQDELVRLILPGTGLPVGGCNGVVPPESQLVSLSTGGTLCFYRGNSDAQIYVCNWSGSACSDTPRNLLAGSPVAMRATSLAFTPLVLVGINSSLDVSFELQVADQTMQPVRFGMNVTLRN